MGICSSCDSTAVTTAKLILHDGTLQEFPYPVKVSYVLQKHPSTFIVNSDDMDFDDVVSAVQDDDVLQLGQLYFALPLARLRRRLQPEEMAALAVKASSALTRHNKNVSFATSNGCTKSSGRVSDIGSRSGRSDGGSGRRCSGRFTGILTVIPE